MPLRDAAGRGNPEDSSGARRRAGALLDVRRKKVRSRDCQASFVPASPQGFPSCPPIGADYAPPRMRLSLASCALLATLFAPLSARAAQACACLGPDGSFGVGTADPATPTADEEALSRPLEDITSLAPAPPPPLENVLWCEGNDGPRCAPQQGRPDTPPPTVPGPALAWTEAPPRDTMDPARPCTPSVGAGPSAGVSDRVDRPPRA